jgi:hypothetical protein
MIYNVNEKRIYLDTKDIDAKMDYLQKNAPKEFGTAMKSYLYGGSAKIKQESVMIAKREAKDMSHYMQGFLITPIQEDIHGMFIKIYNAMMYSMVIEYGGKWMSKMPPVSVIADWVQRNIGISTIEEAEMFAWAIAKNFVKRSKSGKYGQRFMFSKHRGRVLTMNRAVKNSKTYLELWLSRCIDLAIARLGLAS